MKNRFKDTCGTLFFPVVRGAERRLSVRNLYRILRPYSFVRAAFRGIPASVPLPACLGAEQSVRAIRQWRGNGYMNQPAGVFSGEAGGNQMDGPLPHHWT